MQRKKIELYEEDNRTLQDAYAQLIANIRFLSNKNNYPLKTLTVCSYDTKVGKTATAINMSISMAKYGHKVLLVDANFRKMEVLKKVNADGAPGLSQYTEANSNIQNFVRPTNIEKLSYIPSGKKLDDPAEFLYSPAFRNFIATVRDEYDYTIFDSSALSAVIDSAVIAKETDAAILVAQLGSTTFGNLEKAKKQLIRADANLIGVVLTKVKKPLFRKYVESYDYFENLNPVKKE